MSDSAGSKPFDLGSKLVSAERALAAIRAGSRIYIGTGCAAPRTLLTQLEAMDPAPADLEFVSFLTTSALPQVEGASRTHYRHRAFFVGSEMRGLAGSGQLDYVPMSLEEVPRLLTSGRLPIDVALLQVSPPDARGFVSLGVSVDLAPAILSVARMVIAEVNPAMPRTHGESFVHLDRFDAMVDVDVPVTEYLHPKIGEVAERVARYIASIIEDGSTLQIGLGRVPNEALRYLTDRRDLGIHSDVITDGVVDLVEAGVVTGHRKTRHRDRIVASYCLPEDDVYTRFFRRLRSLSYQELQTLCNVNHETDVAFLAVTGPRENEEVIGSACYFLSPTTNLAEVAFMVAPEFQGAGVGTALQARLQEYAMSRGVRGFVAEILPRNTRMLRLAARAPGTMATSRDEDGVHVTVLFRDSAAAV
jgi:RimJ/RimL family protein N-acetyltransferase